MSTGNSLLLGAVVALLLSVTTFSEAKRMNDELSLTIKQQCIITIAAFTASGDMEKLKTALIEGLDAGLTVNEIKEILIQMYAYAGFPRSLNGIHTFMTVMTERQAKGIKDEVGKEASPLPPDMNKDEYGTKVRARLAGQEVIPPPSGYQLFTPVIDTFLKEHLFADIFARDILSHQDRELATIAALANMTGTEGQVRFHLGAAMNSGLTEAQMKDFISVLKSRVGKKEAESASGILAEVLRNRAKREQADRLKIRLKVGDTVLTATLIDSKTTQDFISLLPLTLTLRDYAGTEKISDLPKRLSTEGVPSGSDPSVGDITYYGPWGNLAIFYRDFGYSSGLIILGKIDSGIEAFNVPGSLKVTVELIK